MMKLFRFFIGFFTLLATFTVIYMSASVYDTNKDIEIEPYFFRPWTRPQIEQPKTIAEMGDKNIRNMLVQKYVKEYFYVIPSDEDILERAKSSSVLAQMSSKDVFDNWTANVLPVLGKLSQDGVLRTVSVSDEIFKPENSDYWQVDYELKTWDTPNNLSVPPVITRGTVYLDMVYGGLHENLQEVQKRLLNGTEPATMFIFLVQDIMVTEKQ